MFDIVRRDHNDALSSFKTFADKFFSDFERDFFTGDSFFPITWKGQDAFPKVDILENADCYSVVAAVAGIPKENLKVTLDDGNLILEGSSEGSNVDKTASFIRKEIARRHFKRVFPFDGLITGEVTSRLENGCLIVDLKKKQAEVKQSKVKTVEIQ